LDTYVGLMWDGLVPNPSALVKYILVAAQKEKATELRDKLDNFKDRFMVELTIDMRVEQGRSSRLILIVQIV